MEKVIIFTDGGARGNPGPAGIGVVIEYQGKKKEYAEFIGENKTNNEAEYEALIFALQKTKRLLGKKQAKQARVECYSDSELLVKQLNHQYKIKDEQIQKYFIEIWNLILDFKKVTFFHLPREKNKRADQLANQAVDKAQSCLF
jgi:ribonuclease HI